MEELRSLVPPDLSQSVVFGALASLSGGVTLRALKVWHGEDDSELRVVLQELLCRPSGSPVTPGELADFRVMLAAAAGVERGVCRGARRSRRKKHFKEP